MSRGWHGCGGCGGGRRTVARRRGLARPRRSAPGLVRDRRRLPGAALFAPRAPGPVDVLSVARVDPDRGGGRALTRVRAGEPPPRGAASGRSDRRGVWGRPLLWAGPGLGVTSLSAR